jgi:hypothetical protein
MDCGAALLTVPRCPTQMHTDDLMYALYMYMYIFCAHIYYVVYTYVYYIILYYTILYYIILYYIIFLLYSILLYYIILYSIIFYSILFYSIILYYMQYIMYIHVPDGFHSLRYMVLITAACSQRATFHAVQVPDLVRGAVISSSLLQDVAWHWCCEL